MLSPCKNILSTRMPAVQASVEIYGDGEAERAAYIDEELEDRMRAEEERAVFEGGKDDEPAYG